MNTLIFITFIITNLLLIPVAVPLSVGETLALTEMYNEWNNVALNWIKPVSNACNWNYITCANGNIIGMLLNLFVKLLIILKDK